MSELKALHKEAIPAALEKATRYRLLNEPAEAESICLDVLKADPENQEAIITLLLALTDRRNLCRATRQNKADPKYTRMSVSGLRSFSRGDELV